jgi:hypothetical protein
MATPEPKKESDTFNQALMTFEKIVAGSPTLIFDFLIFDIRNFNLTGKHLIQNPSQLTGGLTLSAPISNPTSVIPTYPLGSYKGWNIHQEPDGNFIGTMGSKVTPYSPTLPQLEKWIDKFPNG